jgi:Protein of unknown function (DUF4240)
MDREQFWARIEAAKTATGGDCRAQTARVVAALSKRSVGEVLAWDRIHGDLMAESYRRDLWEPPTWSTAAAPTTASTTSGVGC